MIDKKISAANFLGGFFYAREHFSRSNDAERTRRRFTRNNYARGENRRA